MKKRSLPLMLAVLVIAISAFIVPQNPIKIDRFALVKRHNVVNTSFDTLSSLSVGNGEFAFTVDPTGLQTFPDSYTNPAYMTDHPVVLGAYGYLPGDGQVDVATMNRTFDHIMKVWSWEQTWGWDYPMVAMSAARLGKPDKAVDALMMKVTKNTYLPNGHNYQRENLRIYLPGNGGLLMAVAMMCAGWDGYKGGPTPGFPKDGTWTVRWENLDKMP